MQTTIVQYYLIESLFHEELFMRTSGLRTYLISCERIPADSELMPSFTLRAGNPFNTDIINSRTMNPRKNGLA